MAQENKAESGGEAVAAANADAPMSRLEKVGGKLLIGGTVMYLALVAVANVVGSGTAVLNPPAEIDGYRVSYVERLPAGGFWQYFLLSRTGSATIILKDTGGLVARLLDNNNNGIIDNGDVVEVMERLDGISGIVKYETDKVVDSDGKTEFTKPSTVLQAQVMQYGRQQRAKWDSWLQINYLAIKAKLLEQQRR